MNRYGTDSSDLDEFEPGSEGKVLRNRRGITDPDEADRLEAALLALAQARSYGRLEPSTPLTTGLIRDLHRWWLESLYDFAGELRTIDLSKGYVRFAPVAYLQASLDELDAVLAVETPCAGMEKERLIRAIARVHVELVLVHPFREGNGRLSRWVADLMALQAGFPPLDWSFDRDTDARREEFFAALRRGFSGHNGPMETLIRQALEMSIRSAEDPSGPP